MKTKMNKRQINLKIDTELDRWVRDTAKKEGTSQIAIYEEALSFARARRAIENHVRDSIMRNMEAFTTEQDFRAYCKRAGKIPENGGRIVSLDDAVRGELYGFLFNWEERGYRESYYSEFFEREYWRPADSLTADAFEEQAELKRLWQEAEVTA